MESEDLLFNAGYYPVARNVRKFLDIKSLAICREVCSNWRDFIDSEFSEELEIAKDFTEWRRYKFTEIHPGVRRFDEKVWSPLLNNVYLRQNFEDMKFLMGGLECLEFGCWNTQNAELAFEQPILKSALGQFYFSYLISEEAKTNGINNVFENKVFRKLHEYEKCCSLFEVLILAVLAKNQGTIWAICEAQSDSSFREEVKKTSDDWADIEINFHLWATKEQIPYYDKTIFTSQDDYWRNLPEPENFYLFMYFMMRVSGRFN